MSKKDYTIYVNQGPLSGQRFKVAEGVVYITGPNGSGKSQLLAAIQHGLVELKTTIDVAHLPTSLAKISASAKYICKEWGLGNNSRYDQIVNLMDDMGQQLPVTESVVDSGPVSNIDAEGNFVVTNTQKNRITHHGVPFSLKSLSTGTEALLQRFLWSETKQEKMELQKRSNKPPEASFILWDEPEANLHPNEQRKLPERIEKWIGDSKGVSRRKHIILVATHSPFVLAGASEYAHEIICLDKCEVVKQSLDGSSPANVRMEANRLLGLGMADVLPERMVITETSMIKLISGFANKFNLKSEHLDITSGGDANGLAKIKDMSSLLKLLKSISRQWPHRDIFNLDITLILDDEEALKRAEQLTKDEGSNIKFFKIGELGLEDSYPIEVVNKFLSTKDDLPDSWDKVGYPKFKSLLGDSVRGAALGEIKSELAEFVVSEIVDLTDLESKIPEAYEVMQNLYKNK